SAFTIEGRPAAAGDIPNSEASFVTPGYFRALGVELVRGRLFDDHDDQHAPQALVVSESFARQFFPGEDAIGRRIALVSRGRNGAGPLQPAPASWLTIAGIVRDVKNAGLDAIASPLLYRSVLQTSNLNLTLVVRTRHDP